MLFLSKIMVETSARHVHVSEQDLVKLFGEGAKLTVKKELSQPGQFASNEKVEVVGPKGSLKMSILGPTRPQTQVEIALTDARKIGITAPTRESGCLEGTPGCKIIGPKGEIDIESGVIIAKRHIHFTPETAAQAGVKDKQIVSVKVDYNDRALTFGDVVVRVSKNYAPAMHIDTDESNAAGLPGTVDGEIIL
ncbi:MAG TPA: phosphate propanoyltransferase [Oscillospiraceae bacterium]|nr:phosphate propanoyltransferase [Oscillospiraceae bacterium]